MALETAAEDLRQKFFKNLSERAANMIRAGGPEIMGPAFRSEKPSRISSSRCAAQPRAIIIAGGGGDLITPCPFPRPGDVHGGTAALHCRTDLRWNDETEALYMEQVRGHPAEGQRNSEQAPAEAESISRAGLGRRGFSAGQAEAVALGQAEAQNGGISGLLRQALMMKKAGGFYGQRHALFQIMRAGLENPGRDAFVHGVKIENPLEEAVDKSSGAHHCDPACLPGRPRERADMPGNHAGIRRTGPSAPLLIWPWQPASGKRRRSGGQLRNLLLEQVRHILDGISGARPFHSKRAWTCHDRRSGRHLQLCTACPVRSYGSDQ